MVYLPTWMVDFIWYFLHWKAPEFNNTQNKGTLADLSVSLGHVFHTNISICNRMCLKVHKSHGKESNTKLALDGGKSDSVDGWHNKDSLLMILTQFHSQSILPHVPPPDPTRQSALLENWRRTMRNRVNAASICSRSSQDQGNQIRIHYVEKHLFHLHLLLKELGKHQCNICTYTW